MVLCIKKAKTVNTPDIKVDRNEKKPKTEGNLVPPELKNINIVCDGIGGETKRKLTWIICLVKNLSLMV